MARAIRAGVAGTGFIGTVHAEALRRIGVEVAGVVGSSEERARAAGIGPAYPSFEALLADPAIDVVHLATPNHLHAVQASAALAAGKHVSARSRSASRAPRPERCSPRPAPAASCTRRTSTCASTRRCTRRARSSRPARRRGPARLRRLPPGLAAPRHGLELAARPGPRRLAAGGCRHRLHWLDMVAFVTGQAVVEVMADLATFIPVRQVPSARSPRSRTARSARRGRARSRPRTRRRSSCGSRTAPAARSRSRRSAPAARTTSPSRSTAPRRPSPGTRSGPTSSGSGIATGRASSRCATRRSCAVGARRHAPPRRPCRGLPRHVRGALPRGLPRRRRRAPVRRPGLPHVHRRPSRPARLRGRRGERARGPLRARRGGGAA